MRCTERHFLCRLSLSDVKPASLTGFVDRIVESCPCSSFLLTVVEPFFFDTSWMLRFGLEVTGTRCKNIFRNAVADRGAWNALYD